MQGAVKVEPQEGSVTKGGVDHLGLGLDAVQTRELRFGGVDLGPKALLLLGDEEVTMQAACW